MRLYLARHGQTSSNVNKALDTAVPGADLTDLGQSQARELATRLEGEKIDTIYTSNLVRTHQTAAPLAERLGITPIEDERFGEVQAGEWEMLADELSMNSYIEVGKQWLTGNLTERMPGAETGEEVLARFDAGLADIRGENVLIVAHGMVLLFWANMRAQRDGGVFLPHMVNTAHAVLEGEPGNWRLVSWPDEGELF